MRVRILTAVAGVVGLAAGALAVTPASAMVPVEPGGSIVQLGAASTTPLGAGSTYTAVTQRIDANIFGVRADDDTLERIKSNGDSTFAIPDGVKDEKILSLSSSGNPDVDANGAIGVVTDDGIPHVWGTGAQGLYDTAATLTSPAVLGGDGDEAAAEQIAVGTNLVGILLSDGRVGAIGSYSGGFPYRVLDLPGSVEQIDAFGVGGSDSGLVLRMTNGGALIWKSSGGSVQGTVITPAFSEMSGSGSGPTDKLIEVQASGSVAVGVTGSGKVYAMNHDGSQADPDVLPPVDEMVGKPVQAAVVQKSGNPDDPMYLVRTDENKLYLYYGGFGAFFIYPDYQTPLDALDLSGKDIVSVVGGANSFQIILADAASPLEVATPAGISGTATVGEELTGTPATFTGGEDEIVNEWLVSDTESGAPVETIPATGASPTLALTNAYQGKWIKFSSTAKRGVDELPSISAAKGPVAPEPDVATSVEVTGAASTTTAAAVTWTATVSAESGTPTGTVTATGPGINVSGTLDGDGKASLALPAGLAAGTHTVTVSYAGGGGFAASQTTKTLTVSTPAPLKVTPTVALKVTKKPTWKKKGKATITVTGGSMATGMVTVTVTGKIKKKGKKAKRKTFTVTGVLVNGTATVKIKKIKNAKGKWTLTATYPGDATHNPAVSSAVKIKVKKK